MSLKKKVFISYSWDSEAHKQWVESLAVKLQKDGFDIILDSWSLRIGHDMLYFMERSVNEADKVLLILTEPYCLKANARQGNSGVGYEFSMISGEMYALNVNNNKFLPVLRQGSADISIPKFFKTRLFLDMRKDQDYEVNYNVLLRDLLDNPLGKPYQKETDNNTTFIFKNTWKKLNTWNSKPDSIIIAFSNRSDYYVKPGEEYTFQVPPGEYSFSAIALIWAEDSRGVKEVYSKIIKRSYESGTYYYKCYLEEKRIMDFILASRITYVDLISSPDGDYKYNDD